MTELQTILIGVLGDQVLVTLLTGGVHLLGSVCIAGAIRREDEEGLCAPDQAMDLPPLEPTSEEG